MKNSHILAALALAAFSFVIVLYLLPDEKAGPALKTGEQGANVIVQQPGLADVMRGPGKPRILKRDVVTRTGDDGLTIKDESTGKTGWVMWIFNRIRGERTYTVDLAVNGGPLKARWSQVRVQFFAGRKAMGQYFYLIKTGNGRFAPQKDARKDMIFSERDGEGWIFQLQGVAKKGVNRMQVMVLPAVGKNAVGALTLKSIRVTEEN